MPQNIEMLGHFSSNGTALTTINPGGPGNAIDCFNTRLFYPIFHPEDCTHLIEGLALQPRYNENRVFSGPRSPVRDDQVRVPLIWTYRLCQIRLYASIATRTDIFSFRDVGEQATAVVGECAQPTGLKRCGGSADVGNGRSFVVSVIRV